MRKATLLAVFFLAGVITIGQAQEHVAAAIIKEATTSTENYSRARAMPTIAPAFFVGGWEAWTQYLKDNLTYPQSAREQAVEGKVIASFVVSPTGQIEDIKIEKSLGYGCDEEVKRLLQASPQ